MPNQGLLTVMNGNDVLMKITTSCYGDKLKNIVEDIKAAWPLSCEEAYAIAKKAGINCENCLVVIDKDSIMCKSYKKNYSLHLATFDVPEFNPSRQDGSTDHLKIVKV